MQKVVGDLGAAFSIAPVRIGGALGLYGAMAKLGATNSAQLASSHGIGRALRARVALPPGCFRLRGIRRASGRFHAPAGTCIHARRSAKPGICAAWLRSGGRALGQHAEGDAGISNRRRRGLERAVRLHRLRDRRVFPARLSRQPDRILAAGTRWRGRAIERRRARCGCRMRPWSHDAADGQRVSRARASSASIFTPHRSRPRARMPWRTGRSTISRSRSAVRRISEVMGSTS